MIVISPIYAYVGDGFFEIMYSIIHLILVLILYIISGYYFTDKYEEFSFSNYYIVALVGVLLWFTAYFDSPNDLNWKNGNGGVFWLVYTIYIVPIETPFNFNDSFSIWTKNIQVNMYILLFLSIIPSIFQALGGFLKIGINDYVNKNIS